MVGWLVGLFYGIATFLRSFNAELNFKQFSLVQVQFLFSISTVFVYE